MRKWMSILVLFVLLVAAGSCTNDEGGTDLDVITPNDTVVSVDEAKSL